MKQRFYHLQEARCSGKCCPQPAAATENAAQLQRLQSNVNTVKQEGRVTLTTRMHLQSHMHKRCTLRLQPQNASSRSQKILHPHTIPTPKKLASLSATNRTLSKQITICDLLQSSKQIKLQPSPEQDPRLNPCHV